MGASPPYNPQDFKALIIEEDFTICQALNNLTQLSVMWWSMLRFKYQPDGSGFTEDYIDLLEAALADCADVEFDGITPNPADFKNMLVSSTSIFCEKFVKLAVGLSNLLYNYMAFEWNSSGTDFSDEYKALLCGIECNDPDVVDVVSLLNYRGFEKWDVVQGEVDLIGIAPYNPVSGADGMYVDLHGTNHRPRTNNDVRYGTIRSKAAFSFPIIAGKQYSIGYSLAGHNITNAVTSQPGQVRVRVLKEDFTQYESVDTTHTPSAWNAPFESKTINFTAGSTSDINYVQFESTQVNSASHNVGAKIDNIIVTNVTDGVVLLSDDFNIEVETINPDPDATPDPDDAKDAIPLAVMEVCEKLSKIVLDFPRNVYDVLSYEFNSAGSGFSDVYKFLVCNPREGTVIEDTDNGFLTSLQAYWNHNEANGDVLDDHAGHSLSEDGGLLSSVSPGVLDTARGYPGTAVARVASGTWNTLEGGDWTIAGWVKFSSLAAGTFQWLFCKGDLATATYQLSYGTDAGKFFANASNVNAEVQVDGDAQVDEWYFVVVRARQVGSTIELQVSYGYGGVVTHGAEVAAGSTNTDAGEDFILGGAESSGVLTNMVNGAMDEWAMWKRALTDAQVEELYNGGTPIPYDDWTV